MAPVPIDLSIESKTHSLFLAGHRRHRCRHSCCGDNHSGGATGGASWRGTCRCCTVILLLAAEPAEETFALLLRARIASWGCTRIASWGTRCRNRDWSGNHNWSGRGNHHTGAASNNASAASAHARATTIAAIAITAEEVTTTVAAATLTTEDAATIATATVTTEDVATATVATAAASRDDVAVATAATLAEARAVAGTRNRNHQYHPVHRVFLAGVCGTVHRGGADPVLRTIEA